MYVYSYLFSIFDTFYLFSVRSDILETLCVVDSEDNEEPLPGPHVLVPHGGVLLLARRVQDVQQTRLPVNHHLIIIIIIMSRMSNKHVSPSITTCFL